MKKSVAFLIAFILSFSIVYAAFDPQIQSELDSKGYAKVLIKLKDSNLPQIKQNLANSEKKSLLAQRASHVEANQKSFLDKTKIQHSNKFSQFSIISAKIYKNEYNSLKNNPAIESIQLERKVEAFLDISAPQVNATTLWPIQIDGINLTGKGETVCIVDTGVNYQHPALGNCSLSTLAISGANESYVLETEHNYTESIQYNFTVSKPGYTNIAVHFANISTEKNFDLIRIYDQNWNQIASYSGFRENFWTPSAQGSILYIQLITDIFINDYGFYIDYVLNGTTNNDYNWSSCSKVIGGWDFSNSDPDPMDDHSHGTHCAGIVASTDSTYTGIAPDAKIIAIKSLDSGGGGTDTDVAAGIDWCINKSAEYNISVISLSLGCSSAECIHWQTYCDNDTEAIITSIPINYANEIGIAVPIAAGNAGWTNGIASPSCVSGAIPVGAVNDNDAIFYNRGNLSNLLAPGISIRAPVLGTSFSDKSGTSMATPHVAAAAALLKQFLKLKNQTNISPNQILKSLNSTGKRIDDTLNSGKNLSRINIYKSVLGLDNPVVYYTTLTENYTSIADIISINLSISSLINNAESCILEWDGVNESMDMQGSGPTASCYKSKSVNKQTYSYRVYANNSNSLMAIAPLRYITITDSPNVTLFSGTNLSSVDITNITNLTLAKTNSNITWLSNTNALNQDFDSNLELGEGFAFMNSSNMNPTLNSSARITFSGVNCNTQKAIYYGDVNTREGILQQGILCPDCSDVQCTENTLTFTVSHFTGYASGENANLTISSNTPKEVNQIISFNASYTNKTSGDFISGATCNISFSDNWNNIFSMDEAGEKYEYNTTFALSGQYNYIVNCSHPDFSFVSASDFFDITPTGVPEFSAITLLLALVLPALSIFYLRKTY